MKTKLVEVMRLSFGEDNSFTIEGIRVGRSMDREYTIPLVDGMGCLDNGESIAIYNRNGVLVVERTQEDFED